MNAPFNHIAVAAARDEIRGADAIHHFYGSHHVLFADATGDAAVLDVLDGVPYLTDIDDGVLVMTNFPNQWLREAGYDEVDGMGIDRYARVYEHIQAHRVAFDVDEGLAALALAVQTVGSYPTQFSIVHDPLARESYLFVGGDATHVWKVSMDTATVETWRGFATPALYAIGEDGVPLSALAAHARADE